MDAAIAVNSDQSAAYLATYRYSAAELNLIRQRAAQLRDQTSRWQRGELSDDEFRPLRLQNGLYIQRHAPMLRLAIPYGLLNSEQVRALATAADRWDRGSIHFTTRQNVQYNWPQVVDVPDLLAYLTDVGLHAIQTSGNCIRNITSDPYAGIADDETVDPRPICELLRQWSTLHPEFHFLPRKFKIAVIGSEIDRAAIRVHDVGIRLKQQANTQGLDGVVADVYVGGGLGRTPMLAPLVHADLPWQQLPSYLEAVMRTYNRYGRRDNLYKARIKILVRSLGTAAFAHEVAQEWREVQAENLDSAPSASLDWPQAAWHTVAAHFPALPPALAQRLSESQPSATAATSPNVPADWLRYNALAHHHGQAYAVTVSLKSGERAPGDVGSNELRQLADLADRYSHGALRSTLRQNLVLPFVLPEDLPALHADLAALGMAEPTVGLAPDLVSCPGGDFCSLANARSLPVAAALREKLADPALAVDLGPMPIQVSGCMNSCGHHHLGALGVLGVDKGGEEWFQVYAGGKMGGVADGETRLGSSLGPALRADQVPEAAWRVIQIYREHRNVNETFTDAVDRLGPAIFKESLKKLTQTTE